MMSQRFLIVWLTLLSCCLCAAGLHAEPVRITDIAGRQVTLKHPAKTFILSEGRYALALGLVREGNPVAGLVGLMQPIAWTYPDLEAQIAARYPEVRNIPLYGGQDDSSVSVEAIIDLKPEVALFGIQDHGPGSRNGELLRQLASAGIKVVFIDFRMDPIRNTQRSLEILGQVFGAAERTGQYLEYYREKLAAIRQGVSEITHRPRVFLQAHPGRFECCLAMASGMLGPFIELAGGTNIAAAISPGPTSQHTVEYLLVENPEVWIGTASGTAKEAQQDKRIVALGPGLSQEVSRATLQKFLQQDGFGALDAVQNKRAYAIWHDFYNSPLNIVAAEAFAKWIHPERFRQADPEATLRHIYQQFLPYEWSGTATIGNDS